MTDLKLVALDSEDLAVISAHMQDSVLKVADIDWLPRDKQFSLEDAACAGRYVHHVSKRITSIQLNDAALASVLIDRRYSDNLLRLFAASAHGRALSEAGFGEDLVVCAAVDSYPVIPIYQDRQITKLGPDRVR